MEQHTKKKFKKDTYLYIEGDEDVDEIYIIQKGEVVFDCANTHVAPYRKGAGAGDVLGLISTMSGRPRMESAILRTDAEILVFNKDSFLALMNNNAEIALKVINGFADELRAYDDMIFSLRGNRETIPLDEQLFKLGAYFLNAGELNHAYYIFSRMMLLFPGSAKCDEARAEIHSMETRGIKLPLGPEIKGVNWKYGSNHIIFCQNEPGNALFLIKEGKVKIYKNHGNSQIMLSILKKGDIFGELAIVSKKPRNATAISDTAAELIPITSENLIAIIQKSPIILKKIFCSISERLWFTYIRIESRLYERPLTRIYAFLENKLMEERISLKSEKPHVFNFGIAELLKMTDLPQNAMGDSMDELLMDQNLHFNFGEIRIESPREIAARAKQHKSRDRLSPGEKAQPADTQKPTPNLEPVPELKTDDKSETASLFNELSDIIYLD